MSKRLVAFFSASGNTKKIAQTLAEAAGADLYEITPSGVYQCRSELDGQEVKKQCRDEGQKIRPELGGESLDIDPYDEIVLGFPIWWYVAPTIINTFLEAHDFTGKTIRLFATSGGSGFGSTVKELEPSAPGATFIEGKVLNQAGKSEIENWIKTW